MFQCLHQQTGLPASTVTNNDEFAANLSHLVRTAAIRQQSFGGVYKDVMNGGESVEMKKRHV